jgi:phytoene synthase
LAFELLAGMRMDVEGTRYASLEELKVYCYRVAGVVGLMMARVMGARDPRALLHARDLGEAMQLTNIARDVAEDERLGRVYLPQNWLTEYGRVATVDRLLTEAERGYVSGLQGLPYLPLRAAWAVASAAFIYRDIGQIVRARLGDTDPWLKRAVVPFRRKLWGVLRGALAVWRSRRGLGSLKAESAPG